MKWTTAVIAANRANGDYLDTTLSSVIRAGWPDVSVYAEPNTVIPEWFKGTVVERRKQYGDWSNWATGLYDLLMTEPDTDYFFISEDDGLYCKGVRQYLEDAIPQLGDFGSLSFYTPSRYHKRRLSPTFHNEGHGKTMWSTLTVIMSKESVIRFFSDIDVQRHRFCDLFEIGKNPEGFKASFGRGRTSVIDCVGNTLKDAIIGHWAGRAGLPVYFHTPSLGQHIGQESTLTEDLSTVSNGRQASDFVGEDCDVSEWGKSEFNVVKRLSLAIM